MFGENERRDPHPAFAFGGHPPFDEDWQPWARDPRGYRGPRGPFFGSPFFGGPPLGRMLWRMARRWGFGPGPFGPGPGPFGPGMGPGGRGGPGPRMFGHGHLKYVLLDLLQERPKHGYEMMKELEDRSGGFYSPSAGAIYPTLQLLEDRGWVTSQTADGKKVCAITDAGRAALKEHNDRQRPGPDPDAFGGPRREDRGDFRRGPFGRPFHGGPWGREARPELHALRHEAMEVVRLTRAAVLATGGDPERLARLRAIVERTRDDLNAFLGQSAPQGAPASERPGATPHAGEGPIESV